MKKTLKFLTIFLLVILLLPRGCSLIWGNFNLTMMKKLGDIENYTEYTCIFNGTKQYEDSTYIDVELVGVNEEVVPDWGQGNLEVIPGNVEILKENGFFEEVKQGDTMSIKANFWIYGDAPFFFVASVKVGDKVYLDEQIAMRNIRRYMMARPSLF